jgi:sugar O-acyltransferase (sialic acid O-acetyltransferase NeuD family)
MSNNKIAVFGAGGFGREVQMLIHQINQSSKTWEFIGFFDDKIKKGTMINDSEVIGTIKDINEYEEVLNIVIAVGNPKVKKHIVDQITNPKISYPILIHPSVTAGYKSIESIGEGTIICSGVILTVNCTVGKHVLLNLYSTVGHDSVIGDYTSCMPNVNIGGNVNVGNCVLLGIGAKVINNIKIGNNCMVSAVSPVTKNIPEDYSVIHHPSRAFPSF